MNDASPAGSERLDEPRVQFVTLKCIHDSAGRPNALSDDRLRLTPTSHDQGRERSFDPRSTAEGAGPLGAYLQGRRRAGRRRRSEAPRSRSWAQHVPIPPRMQDGGAARSAQWRCNERATDRSEPGGRIRLALTPASSSLTPNTSERHWPARRIHPGGRRTSGPQTAERNFRGRGKSRR